MSKSPSNTRSPTPTSENPTANLRRNITEEHSRDSQSSGIRDESFAPLPIPPPPTQDTLGRPIRPAENSTSDSRMTKRIRTSDVGSGFNMQSGSSQHVQDNVASSSSSRITDSREQPTAVQSAPPKKKRTRTLTTPHQAAVLHALLAKSRFPTTAMREEVGRSIGLSARKVQIWFQNQRQKARRPGGQSEASCRGRPQYGAFSSAPPVPEYGNQLSFNTRPDVNSLPLIQLASSSSQSLQPTGDYVSTPESYSTLSDTPSQLLGPGVPGLHMRPRGAPLGGSSSSTSISLPQMDQLDVNYPATRSVHRNSPPNSPNSVHLLPPPLSVPSHLQDAYPTLPPLMGLQTRASASPPGGPVQSLPGHLSLIETQPGTMDRPFIHYRPASPRAVATPASSSATPGSIPPPFTLQPRPQWDRRSFTPSLARSNLWSSPSSNRSSVSPTQPFFIPSARSPHMSSVSTPNLGRHDATEPIGEKTDWDAQPMTSQTPPSSQSRVGRYDPVRATVIPFPTALPPPPRSPSDTEHMKDRS